MVFVRPLSSLLLCGLLQFSVAGSTQSPPAFAGGVSIGTIASTNLAELSGLAASRRNPGVLWTHNDGGRDRVYGISTNGQLLATYEVNENVTDAEDILIGPGPLPHFDYLYLGDIGDNLFNRPTFNVYRMPEPAVYAYQAAIPESDSFKLVERLTFAYPDGSYDTEAFFCDSRNGDLYFATKQSPSRIYRAPSEQLQTSLVITCSFVGTAFLGEPSGATMSFEANEIILRQESFARLWQVGAEQNLRDALAGAPLTVPVIGPPLEPNGESISYHPNGLGYYTVSEGINQPIYFFAKTNGAIPRQPAMLLPRASAWRYRDNGSDQGIGWRQPGFDDQSWSTGAGQLGYGNGDEQTVISFGGNASQKYITTYFRSHFTIIDPSAIEQLTLSCVFDDGVAIYINGTEALRRNLAANAGYNTTALGSGSDFENLWHTFSISATSLVPGTNVVAVEVHRRSASEGDLSFDLQLQALLRAAPLQFVSPPEQLPNGAWVLAVRGTPGSLVSVEASPDLSNWAETGNFALPQTGTGRFTNSPAIISNRFFRLRN